MAARPLGPKVDFDAASWPPPVALRGAYVCLEPVVPARHGPQIWDHIKDHPQVWDYLYEDVPLDADAFMATLVVSVSNPAWRGYAVCVDGVALGYAFYLNIVPQMGSIEVGNINLFPKLQRTPAATEAMFLMMKQAFDLGYRRYEWKCNALNAPSRRAAQRLGFSWEGTFRQHVIVKTRNRDTAWFGMTDQDWPQMKLAFEAWLSPDNFDGSGQQRTSLTGRTTPHRVASDPAS